MIHGLILNKLKCPSCNVVGNMSKSNNGTTAVDWYSCSKCKKTTNENDLWIHNDNPIVTKYYAPVFKVEMVVTIPLVESCLKCPLTYERTNFSCCILDESVEEYTKLRHPNCPMEIKETHIQDKLIKTTIESKEGIVEIKEDNNE